MADTAWLIVNAAPQPDGRCGFYTRQVARRLSLSLNQADLRRFDWVHQLIQWIAGIELIAPIWAWHGVFGGYSSPQHAIG